MNNSIRSIGFERRRGREGAEREIVRADFCVAKEGFSGAMHSWTGYVRQYFDFHLDMTRDDTSGETGVF